MIEKDKTKLCKILICNMFKENLNQLQNKIKKKEKKNNNQRSKNKKLI